MTTGENILSKKKKRGKNMAQTSSSTSSTLSVSRITRGRALNSQSRQLVLNVFYNIRGQDPCASITSVIDRTSELTGIPFPTIYSIVNASSSKSTRPTSPSIQKKIKPVDEKDESKHFSESDLTGIRHKVHDFYLRNETPTFPKLLKAINEDELLPSLTQKSLKRLLNNLGFDYIKRNGAELLLERTDIIAWRRQFLRRIKQYRDEGRRIYYMDETWVDTNRNVYQDNSDIDDKAKAENRLLVIHAGSEMGFVEGALGIIREKKGSRDAVDASRFENWFQTKFLPQALKKSVIVIDDASHHNSKLETIPNMAWKKEDIKQWLREQQISWNEDSVKVELLYLVDARKERYKVCRVDTIAALHDIIILRLPPHHSKLSPMEEVWIHIKDCINAEEKPTSLQEIETLVQSALSSFTPQHWKHYLQNVKLEEERMWDLDNIAEETVENISDYEGTSASENSDTDKME